MTNSKNTKRALFTSVLSVLLCVAMLIGSTFAWFTDSVTSGNNRIVAGNLDVELYYKNASTKGEWKDASKEKTENPNFFVDKDGKDILWEPGAMAVTQFKVENVGTLAFKYAFALLAVKYNQLDGRDLRDVIKFGLINGELSEGSTAEDARDLTTFYEFPDFIKRSALLPNDGVDDSGEDQEIFTIVAWWKPDDKNDNLYNLSNGKIATELDGKQSDPNQLYLDIDIHLNAWQDTVESDSFDNQYDAIADALDIFPDGCHVVTDRGTWVELDIYTGRSTEDIKISYTGYAPDNTDERMRSWKTDGSGTIKPAAANGNTHLIFFKTADKGSFMLTQEDHVLPALQVKEDGTLRQSRAVYSARNAVAARSVSAAQSVSNEAGLRDVIAALNTNGGETTVKLSGDIEITSQCELNKGTLTILGEGHSITNKVRAENISISGTAKLNLGADGYEKGLTIKASDLTSTALIEVGGNANVNIYKGTVIDGSATTHSAQSGGVAIFGSATVNMHDGTIQYCSSDSTGGGVCMADSAQFNMIGGEIINCHGLYGGAVGIFDNRIGVGTRACNALFTMSGGTIRDCSSDGALLDIWNKYYIAGGGAVCMYGTDSSYYKAQFIMNGGLITGCGTNLPDAQSDVYGGAIFVSCGTVNLNSGKITKNKVTAGKPGNEKNAYGGGIGSLWINKCSITITINEDFNLYNNSAQTAGDDIANCSVSSTYGTISLANVKNFGFYNPKNVEHTGGTWYKDEPNRRASATIPFMTANTKLTAKYIKVFHEEEPEPVLATIKFINLETKEIYKQDDLELGTPIQIPEFIPTMEGRIFTGWFDDKGDPFSPTTAKEHTTYHASFCPLEGAGTPGRLLDLYNGTGDSAAISKGGAKTVRWTSEYSSLATNVNASAPIKAGTKITMAYYPDKDDRTIVSYYYLIVPADITTISLGSFTVMGGSKHFVPNVDGPCRPVGWESKEPIYQFSFVFPEEQEDIDVWMSYTKNDNPNGSKVSINIADERIPVPSGKLEATGNGYTVKVSDLNDFNADPSDSRHNTNKPLANRKAVLAFEAVDAQGKTVAMLSDTTVTVGGKQAKVSAGIAAAEITGDGAYVIEVSGLQPGAVGIRVSLCYTYNNIIYKPMANVLASVTVKP